MLANVHKTIICAKELGKIKALDEVLILAEFHSTPVPITYNDGTTSTEKVISIAELEYIVNLIRNRENQ